MRKIIHRTKKLTQSQKEEIIKLHIEKRLPIEDIAKKFSITKTAIYYYFRSRNIPLLRNMPYPDDKKNKGHSYYYYINKSYKKGEITQKRKNQILNRFYRNRQNQYLRESPVEDYYEEDYD